MDADKRQERAAARDPLGLARLAGEWTLAVALAVCVRFVLSQEPTARWISAVTYGTWYRCRHHFAGASPVSVAAPVSCIAPIHPLASDFLARLIALVAYALTCCRPRTAPIRTDINRWGVVAGWCRPPSDLSAGPMAVMVNPSGDGDLPVATRQPRRQGGRYRAGHRDRSPVPCRCAGRLFQLPAYLVSRRIVHHRPGPSLRGIEPALIDDAVGIVASALASMPPTTHDPS